MITIDVGTTAIPRLLTEKCIGSFRDQLDATGFRLRWLVYLDQYPGMEANWERNRRQIFGLAQRFDEFDFDGHDQENIGYGGAVLTVMQRVQNDLLWIEDDWLWLEPIRLADVIEAAQEADGLHFTRPSTRFGATSPTFWKRHAVETLVRYYPHPPRRASENNLKFILARKFGYRYCWHNGKVPYDACIDVGRREMARLGYEQNFLGIDLSPYRMEAAYEARMQQARPAG